VPLRLLVLGAMLALAPGALAQTRKPPLPPGRDPGGVAIALLSTGIDYTQPDIARRLARDGEGELIGLDLQDGDNRPFAAAGVETRDRWGGDGTALAKAVGGPGRRIVPVRIDPGNGVSIARAVAFLAQTPARIVVVPMWGAEKAEWEPFRQAASHFRDLLFIVAAGDEGKDIDEQPAWPAAFGVPNVLVVTAPLSRATESTLAPNGGDKAVDALVSATRQLRNAMGQTVLPPDTTRMAAVLAADALAGCWPQLVASFKGEALKTAFLAEAAKAWPNATKPIIERCIDGAAPQR
jgi:hypothetical protein